MIKAYCILYELLLERVSVLKTSLLPVLWAGWSDISTVFSCNNFHSSLESTILFQPLTLRIPLQGSIYQTELRSHICCSLVCGHLFLLTFMQRLSLAVLTNAPGGSYQDTTTLCSTNKTASPSLTPPASQQLRSPAPMWYPCRWGSHRIAPHSHPESLRIRELAVSKIFLLKVSSPVCHLTISEMCAWLWKLPYLPIHTSIEFGSLVENAILKFHQTSPL